MTFQIKKHKKVTTSLPLMEPTMEGCLLGSFKCFLKWGQAIKEALGCSKVLHKGLKKHKKRSDDELQARHTWKCNEGACVPLEVKLGDGRGRM
jgi:hypothetical protein